MASRPAESTRSATEGVSCLWTQRLDSRFERSIHKPHIDVKYRPLVYIDIQNKTGIEDMSTIEVMDSRVSQPCDELDLAISALTRHEKVLSDLVKRLGRTVHLLQRMMEKLSDVFGQETLQKDGGKQEALEYLMLLVAVLRGHEGKLSELIGEAELLTNPDIEVVPVTSDEAVRILSSLNTEELDSLLDRIKVSHELWCA